MSNLNLIKQLRESTNLSLDLCKKALEKSNWKYDLALEELRKSGELRSSKLSGNATSEGRIFSATLENGKSAVLLKVLCQTDFAARSNDFLAFGQQSALDYLHKNYAGGQFGFDETKRQELSAKLGENVVLNCVAEMHLSADSVGQIFSYCHSDGKYASLVELHCQTKEDAQSDDLIAFGQNLAMEIAGLTTVRFLSSDQIPEEEKEKEKQIALGQLQNSSKKIPPEKLDAILLGKMKTWYAEVCLLDSKSLLNPKKTIEQLRAELSVKLGENVTVARFIRWER